MASNAKRRRIGEDRPLPQSCKRQDRRYLLYYLDEHDVANSEELARHITAQKSNRSQSAVPEEKWKSVQTQLQHNHLPKLADFGIVEYDERSRDVYFPNPSHGFKTLLDFCKPMEKQS